VGSLENDDLFAEEWTKGELLERLVFPGYWPPGLPRLTLRWIAEVYDPRTMPTLQLAKTPEGNISLLGWKSEDGEGPGLIEAVRGFPLTDAEQRITRLWPTVQWCPRCWKDGFVALAPEEANAEYAAKAKEAYEAGFFPPALSRTSREPEDAPIYVCSDCGQAEAMEEWGGRLTPPEGWPINGPGFGLGIQAAGHYGMRSYLPGPYGTNEGDIWGAEGSDIQERLPEGKVLIHEVIDGEEKVYVTTDPELIERAAAGTIKYLAQKAEEN